MSLKIRRKRAAEAAKTTGVDALLVTHLPVVSWLCGFTGSYAAMLVLDTRAVGAGKSGARGGRSAGGGSATGLKAVLFTDGRYTTQARAEATGVQVVIAPKAAAVAGCEWLAGAGSGARAQRCGFDDGNTTVAALKQMRAAVPAKLRRGLFEPVGALVSKLRWIKDPAEIAKMRRAAALGCRLFEEMLGVIEPGMTEDAVAAELEYRARLAGAEAMSFPTIVAGGERSALPHGRATSAKLPRRGFVTMDFGVVLDGYCSDMTRTVHIGPRECRRASGLRGGAGGAGGGRGRGARRGYGRRCGRGGAQCSAQCTL